MHIYGKDKLPKEFRFTWPLLTWEHSHRIQINTLKCTSWPYQPFQILLTSFICWKALRQIWDNQNCLDNTLARFPDNEGFEGQATYALCIHQNHIFVFLFALSNYLGKLPGGSSKINRLSLNRCPPYTEIFSKRRKIYSVCVEVESLRITWWESETLYLSSP